MFCGSDKTADVWLPISVTKVWWKFYYRSYHHLFTRFFNLLDLSLRETLYLLQVFPHPTVELLQHPTISKGFHRIPTQLCSSRGALHRR